MLDQASRSELWKKKYESKQARHEKKNIEIEKKTSQRHRDSKNFDKTRRIAAAMDIARKKLAESCSN